MVALFNQTNSTCQLSKNDLTDGSDTVYYSTGEDNTFGTYMTSFLLAITLLLLTVALSRKYVPDFHVHSFLFYIISLGILSVSVFVAGFFYAVCSDKEELCHRDLRNLSFFCQCFSAAFVCMSGLGLLLKREFTCKNHMIFMLTAAAGFSLSIISFVVPVEYATAALIGNFGPNVFLFYAILRSGQLPDKDDNRCSLSFSAAKGLYITGFLVYLLGALLQVSGTVPCGTPCPVDCPYDVPYINHNGAMYICFTLAYILKAAAYYFVASSDAKQLATFNVHKVVPGAKEEGEDEEEQEQDTQAAAAAKYEKTTSYKAETSGSDADVELGVRKIGPVAVNMGTAKAGGGSSYITDITADDGEDVTSFHQTPE